MICALCVGVSPVMAKVFMPFSFFAILVVTASIIPISGICGFRRSSMKLVPLRNVSNFSLINLVKGVSFPAGSGRVLTTAGQGLLEVVNYEASFSGSWLRPFQFSQQ